MSGVNTVAAVERNGATLELEENSPRMSFSYAWTHGRLSVKIWVACDDWMMKGAKCLIAAPVLNASTSIGSHVTWCLRSFALKNPASSSLSLLRK